MNDRGRSVSLVQLVRVVSPCSRADRAWGRDERTWHCPDCQLEVRNFSAMTEAEANAALENAKGRVCARYVSDRRGAPITRDRWIALWLAHARNRLVRIAAALGLAALLGSRLAGCAMGGDVKSDSMKMGGVRAPSTREEAGMDGGEQAPAEKPAALK